jgi:hypothetical protein
MRYGDSNEWWVGREFVRKWSWYTYITKYYPGIHVDIEESYEYTSGLPTIRPRFERATLSVRRQAVLKGFMIFHSPSRQMRL